MENISDEIIEIGDIVNIQLSSIDDEPEEMVIKLVEEAHNTEIDVTQISVNSPLGKSIYKKKVGEITNYKVNDNVFNVTILNKIKDLVKTKQITIN